MYIVAIALKIGDIILLLVLSTMVTTASLGVPTTMPLGSEDESIIRRKVSLLSFMLSFVTKTGNDSVFIPLGTVMVYGPVT